MKQAIPLQYAAIKLDEEKMWKSPTARIGKEFHYDLETEFPLSRAQMEALIAVVAQFREGIPCQEQTKFEMRRMVEE